MSFAKDKEIPIRVVLVFRRNIHLVKVKFHQNFHNRHIAADMTAAPCHNDIHSILTQFIGEFF